MDNTAAAVVQPWMKSKSKAKMKRKSLKVVYISTPMKVKTSASRFRALVQELTGRNSDISRFDHIDVAADDDDDDHDGVSLPPVDRSGDSPESSEYSLFDEVFSSHMVEELEGMFPSSLFHVSRPIPPVDSQFDAM